MIQVGRGADLPRETLHAQRFGEVGPEDLDGDVPLVSEVAGEVYRCRTALAQFTLDEVAIP